MNSRPTFNRFTIIEIIVVILIALIIIAMTAGTIMNAGDGIRLDSSARLVGSVLMRGRQEAIAKRRLVAVIMPGKNADIPNEKKYGAIRLAYVTADESTSPTSYVFDDFLDDTKWGFMQPGISIMEADADCGILYYDSGGKPVTSTNPVDDEKFVIEDHLGNKVERTTLTTVNDVDLTGLGGGAKVDGIRSVIFSSTSRLRADSVRYITVGQANFNGGRWLIKNPTTQTNAAGTTVNESSANQITIEVNRFTGGIRYLTPDKYPTPETP